MDTPFELNSEMLRQLYEQYTDAVKAYNWDAQGSKLEDLWPEIEPLTALQFQTFIENAFWASLKHEEGRFHDFSLLAHPPTAHVHRFIFEKPHLFSADNLAKIAPAFDASSTSILVWPGHGAELCLHGFAPLGETGLSATTVSPGQLIVSFSEIKILHFSILITGTRWETIGVSDFLTWLIPEAKQKRRVDVFREHREHVQRALDYRDMITDMRSHQHGGTLLIVNPSGEWTESLVQPVTFLGEPYRKITMDCFERDETIAKVKKEEIMWPFSPGYRAAKDLARKSIRTIGKLTAIDGAAVVADNLEILAFGAKIKPRGNARPASVFVTQPFKDSPPIETSLAGLGGTRHQSAAQFVFDQHDALAFVTSQDGRVSVMRWDVEKEAVAVIRPAEFALV